MTVLPADDHFIQIYKSQAAAYHALIAAEDADGNLLPALQSIASFAGKRVLDLGSGSGRVPLLLIGLDCEIVALDVHQAMLIEQARQTSISAKRTQAKPGSKLPRLVQADLRGLPLAAGWADVSIAGWAIGHFTGWVNDWEAEAERALEEMRRATKPGGALIVLETLGTGVQEAAAPNAALAAYYQWLESEQGFSRWVVVTDYDFGSLERAVELCGFFFGEQMAERVRTNGWSRVPEWTGVWGKALN
ncbi:MAG: class I SAM-dependent methyltransferase [Anaerolineales bacterium]